MYPIVALVGPSKASVDTTDDTAGGETAEPPNVKEAVAAAF